MIDLWARRKLAELEKLLDTLQDPTRVSVVPPLTYLGSPGLGQVLAIEPPLDKPRNVKAVDGVLANGKFAGLLQTRDNDDEDFDDDWPNACWILDLAGRSSLPAGAVFNGLYVGVEGGGSYFLAIASGTGNPLDDAGHWVELPEDVDPANIPAWAAGVWAAGSLATDDGSTWLANVETTDEPGSSSAWRSVNPANAGVFSGVVTYYSGNYVTEAWPTYAIGDPDTPPIPPVIPTPTITDPAGGVATGPYFSASSKDGTMGIVAKGKNVDFSAAFGAMQQIYLIDGNGNPQCLLWPAQWYLGAGPCGGSGSGTPATLEFWYGLQAPAFPFPGSGGGSGPFSTACGPCAVTSNQYCIAYPSFDPDFADAEGCDIFATAGYQTVTYAIPCAWTWQEDDLPCAVTFGFVGNTAYVQFGNAPYEQQLGRYEADASAWDCLTTPLLLTLTDPALWPNSPSSVTVYPGPCPPPMLRLRDLRHAPRSSCASPCPVSLPPAWTAVCVPRSWPV